LDLAEAPRPGGEVVAPPRFLARWDSVLLAHEPKQRARILPAHHQARVYTNNADVLPTFLVDGIVAGTWSIATDRTAARLVARAFEAIAPDARAGLEAEAARLMRFMAPHAGRHEVEVGVVRGA
jgi:hypothetical protein